MLAVKRREVTGLNTYDGVTQRSIYRISLMDCPSEERIIRLALGSVPDIQNLSFDLPKRQLTITHQGSAQPISSALSGLGLGSELIETVAAEPQSLSTPHESLQSSGQEAATLKLLLGINAAMFVVELIAGVMAESAGLIADSLDMFADAAVYGLALYAVGRGLHLQRLAARTAGIVQIILAAGVLLEVVRRFVFGSEPESSVMIVISLVALAANISCLLLLSGHRQGGVHMKASWIFSANDVLINVGVIVAGALVAWTGSYYPDLIIGCAVAIIVLNGARRILALT